MLWVIHMTVDYPARLFVHCPRRYLCLRRTTQVCILKDIMRSGLTMVVAYKYKEACSCIGSATHAPKQFDLVKGNAKIALKTCDWKDMAVKLSSDTT